MVSFRPRTIRGQLTGGLVIFEILVLAVLSLVVISEQHKELQTRTDQRLEYEASQIALQSTTMLESRAFTSLEQFVSQMRGSPGVSAVVVTDPTGRLLADDGSSEVATTLTPTERSFLRNLDKPAIFTGDRGHREAVAPVRVHGVLQALVWIYPDDSRDKEQLHSLLRTTLLSALFGIAGCTLFASLMARQIARPLGVLTRATRKLIRNPEDTTAFPIPISASNEAADLTMAFNLMVASINEQRAGLNDTLALLDSMLANAPIGFAFFDHRLRMVRVNQFLAGMNNLTIGRHLGKTLEEVFTPGAAQALRASIEQVFADGEPVRDLEVTNEDPVQGRLAAEARSWLANIYPVRTETQTVRWVGMILAETTERRRADDALRKSEKLAAAGRLAASIAHEINNPLEAVTNLLYLIHQSQQDIATRGYTELAQAELARISEITQQMLRFYKQSTKPAHAEACALLDSVLSLHERRAALLQIDIDRRYENKAPLFCFTGEMRQLFNNFIANAIDAMTPGGGRLVLRVRRIPRDWKTGLPGVRVTFADTGCGMSDETRRHIFEPFFTTKEDTGTGLGLWVSAEILAKHHGRLWLRSLERNADHGGSTVFTVFLPEGLEQQLQAETPALSDAQTV
ncbi:ATP-binding protein [Silvibacterium sp.]|uniref:two-component system sensor histidine kinase NtrB n=1 Tax=Silvibacterium sp. TaxID=1964179 RepID=UPI0039E2B29C